MTDAVMNPRVSATDTLFLGALGLVLLLTVAGLAAAFSLFA